MLSAEGLAILQASLELLARLLQEPKRLAQRLLSRFGSADLCLLQRLLLRLDLLLPLGERALHSLVRHPSREPQGLVEVLLQLMHHRFRGFTPR
jgi:hypothetical protein